MSQPRDWLDGAIDLHVHGAPSIFARRMNDLELVRAARDAGMRGLVLKAHEGSTAERAALVNAAEPGVLAIGGVVLNHFVGGINPRAVEMSFSLGGRIVWMPTLHARNHLGHYGREGFNEQTASLSERPAPEAVAVLDEAGRPRREVLEVLEVIAAFDGVLSSGHLGTAETAAVFRAARAIGVGRMVVAHPELELSGFELEFQIEMTRLGAVIERCYLPHRAKWGGFPIEQTALEIRRLGVENCVLSTDLGQADSPAPTDGLREFCDGLARAGLAATGIRAMVRANPASLLGLPPAP